MKINRLHLSDFRGVGELVLDVQGKSAILFGINGVGKSTILSAVNLLYVPILNKLTRQKIKQPGNIKLSDIRTGKASADISAEFMFAEDGQVLPFGRGITYENRRISNNGQLERLVEHYETLYVGRQWVDENNDLMADDQEHNIPIFVNYGVNRLVLKTPLRFRKRPSYGRFEAFEKAIEDQIAFDRLFEWFFDQEYFEIKMQKEDPDYRDKELTAVKTAMLAMLDDCEDIHIVAKPYSMRITKDGEDLDILQLSDGEKCTLALFGDIARRLAQANPSLEDPLKGKGVVLIDELELHMHTSWQRKVIPALNKTFPDIQFIITTHSPQILGEVGEELAIFSLSRAGKEIEVQPLSSLFGVDSNAILEDNMQTDAVSRSIKSEVEKMYDLIEQKDYENAERAADRIDRLTCSRNADTVRARVMIRRGKIRYAKD